MDRTEMHAAMIAKFPELDFTWSEAGITAWFAAYDRLLDLVEAHYPASIVMAPPHGPTAAIPEMITMPRPRRL